MRSKPEQLSEGEAAALVDGLADMKAGRIVPLPDAPGTERVREFVQHKPECPALRCAHVALHPVLPGGYVCGTVAGPWHDHEFKPGKCTCGLNEALAAAASPLRDELRTLTKAVRWAVRQADAHGEIEVNEKRQILDKLARLLDGEGR